MSTIDDMKAELAAKRSALHLERKARHDAEFVSEVYPLLVANEDHIHVEVPGASGSLPGHIVLRPMTRAEVGRVKSVFAKSKDKPGVIEEQAKVTEQIARHCRVYPTEERYEALVNAHPLVPEQCSDALLARAKAATDEHAK